MKLDHDQQAFFDRIATNEPGIVSLYGEAGTGKTTALNELRSLGFNILWCAPTAKAAMLIRGRTVHSTFGVPVQGIRNPRIDVKADREQDRYTRHFSAREKQLKHVHWIVIDERSQVRCDTLDFVDRAMQRVKRNRKPFGGVGVILVGDSGQLQPVIDEREALELGVHGYQYPYTCEMSQVIQSYGVDEYALTIVHRQEDKSFSDLLSRVRLGKQTDEDLGVINSRVGQPSKDSIIITPLNRVKHQYNSAGLNAINSPLIMLEAERKGTFLKKPEKQLPFLERIPVKLGCRVIIKQNMLVEKDPEIRVVNGDTGTLVKVAPEFITIKVDRLNHEVSLPKFKCDDVYNNVVVGESGEKEFQESIRGSYIQFPIDLGYASTVHNSQGQSMPKVHFDLGDATRFIRQCYALSYVGLSRVTALEGLTLQRPLEHADIVASPEAKAPKVREKQLTML